MGTPQSEDQLACEDRANKHHGFGGFVTDDGKYLCVHVWKGTLRKNMFYYKALDDAAGPMVKLIDKFEALR